MYSMISNTLYYYCVVVVIIIYITQYIYWFIFDDHRVLECDPNNWIDVTFNVFVHGLYI